MYIPFYVLDGGMLVEWLRKCRHYMRARVPGLNYVIYAREPHVKIVPMMCIQLARLCVEVLHNSTQLLKKLFIFDNNLDMLLSFRFARSPILLYKVSTHGKLLSVSFTRDRQEHIICKYASIYTYAQTHRMCATISASINFIFTFAL